MPSFAWRRRWSSSWPLLLPAWILLTPSRLTIPSPLADLTIASEYNTDLKLHARWSVTVKNNTVGAHPGMHVYLVKVRFTISDPVRGDTTSLWTIRDLPPGGSVISDVSSLQTIPAATDGPAKVPQRLYAEIIESEPVESPRFQFNNATEHWAIENRRNVRANNITDVTQQRRN